MTRKKQPTNWIGVDLDGTLAHYDGWKGISHIGDPIPLMLDRVKSWLAQGFDVRVFTARCAHNSKEWRPRGLRALNRWTKEHLGRVLPATCEKDGWMLELWDDRAVGVHMNTGKRKDGKK